MSLTISLVQTDLVWENAEVNRLHIEELLWGLEEETDLIILPELFSTAFSFSDQLSEPHNLHTFKWMKQMACLKNACILGSYLIKEKGRFYNRCYCVFPNGNYQTYDKRHLFSLSTEKEFCTPGNKQPILEIKGWEIMPSICYDLRFPVWLRNTNKYDILINIANWPSQRKEAWQSLLQARSIENQCFTVGVNRIGTDENQLIYNGESSVYCPQGNNLIKMNNRERIETITIKKEDLTHVRNTYPFLNDQDQFKIDI